MLYKCLAGKSQRNIVAEEACAMPNDTSRHHPAAAVKAIIFDMDGLMLDTERLAKQHWQAAAQARGFELSDDTYLAVVGRPIRDTYRYFRELFGIDFPAEEIRAERLRLTEEHIATKGVPIKPGLIELLQFCKAQKLALAVATSTERNLAEKKLRMAGILEHFSIQVYGDEIERGKPNPDIYLAAAERLGIAPSACIALEDSAAGIQAASSAGMRSIMVPDLITPSPEIAARASYIVDSLGDAQSVIEALLKSA